MLKNMENFINNFIDWFTSKKRQNLIEKRLFNYYFDVGTKVKLDDKLLNSRLKKQYKELIDVKGTIIECYSDMHAFGHGKHYTHQIIFDNGINTKDNFLYSVPCYLLIEA